MRFFFNNQSNEYGKQKIQRRKCDEDFSSIDEGFRQSIERPETRFLQILTRANGEGCLK